MAVILFDPSYRNLLAPLSTTKALSHFHFGLLSTQERWELLLKQPAAIHTAPYLQGLYVDANAKLLPANAAAEASLWIDASVIPDDALVAQIQSLQNGDCLMDEQGLVAGKAVIAFNSFNPSDTSAYFTQANKVASVQRIRFP